MTFVKKFSVYLLISIFWFPKADADETILTFEKLHISYLRQYMATNRFFDRLNTAESHPDQPVQDKIKAALIHTRREYNWVLREYPLYESIPYLTFYALSLIAGGAAYTFKDAIDLLLARDSVIVNAILFMGFPLGSALVLASTVPFGMNVYYLAFVPKLAEKNLIIGYGAKKNLLDKRTQHYIEDELFYSFWRSPSSEALSRLQKILDKALRLPFYTKKLVYDENKIDEVLQDFSTAVADRLKLFAHSELIYQQTDSTLYDSHYPIYFQGAPGTGKTYAARQLAEAMGTNLAVVTLDGATIDDIVGTPFENADAKAGRLLDAIVARTSSSQDINHHNQILLIDEFDRLFISGDEKSKDVLSFMLKLLDPANRSFYSPYLKTEIRLPDTIILAGNRDIHQLSAHDPELEAIASRLDKLVFDGFSTQTKKIIAFDIMVPNKEKRFQSAGKLLANFTLPESGHHMIANFIETDQDPGLRSLEKYISKVFEKFAHSLKPL